MARYLIIDPEALKAAVVANVEADDEQEAVAAVPYGHPLPKVVVVADAAEAGAVLTRFVVNDESDVLLPQDVAAVITRPPFQPAEPSPAPEPPPVVRGEKPSS
jgi:hypothetical protein